MRNTLSSFYGICAALLILGGIGCGGSDGGTDPGPDSCSLTVTTPQAGASYESGQSANIRWEQTGDAASISITLWQSGTEVGILTAGTENTGFFPWNADVMGGQGGDFTVRVSAVGETGCAAESGVFSIVNTAACDLVETIAFPRDTSLIAGETLPITWQSHDTLGDVGIELMHGHVNPVLVGTIARETFDDGEYDWVVDSFNDAAHRTVVDNSLYWLRIFAEDVSGCEDRTADFELIDDDVCSIGVALIPSQINNHYALGDTVRIGYTVSNGMPGLTVKLRLYAGNMPVPGGFIADGLPADSSELFPWVVDDFDFIGGSYFHVRAVMSDDEYCWGESDAFSITQ